MLIGFVQESTTVFVHYKWAAISHLFDAPERQIAKLRRVSEICKSPAPQRPEQASITISKGQLRTCGDCRVQSAKRHTDRQEAEDDNSQGSITLHHRPASHTTNQPAEVSA